MKVNDQRMYLQKIASRAGLIEIYLYIALLMYYAVLNFTTIGDSYVVLSIRVVAPIVIIQAFRKAYRIQRVSVLILNGIVILFAIDILFLVINVCTYSGPIYPYYWCHQGRLAIHCHILSGCHVH